LNDLVERERQQESSAARRGSLDDGAYYQAQVDSLNRDNRMLRARIRVLERQIAELSASSSSSSASAGGAAVASTENTAAVTSNAGVGDAAAARDEPQATEKNVTG
jgi:cell division septum initiation protein DivIVA